jgi:hypothetical protein
VKVGNRKRERESWNLRYTFEEGGREKHKKKNVAIVI